MIAFIRKYLGTSKESKIEGQPPPIAEDIEQSSRLARPKILCIDLPDNSVKAIRSHFQNVQIGTFGSLINLPPYKHSDHIHQIFPDTYLPKDTHEFDVFIVDLNSERTINYNSNSREWKNDGRRKNQVLIASQPQEIFNPRPLGSQLFRQRIHELRNRDSLLIVFASEAKKEEYEYCSISGEFAHPEGKENGFIYGFHDKIHPRSTKYGKELLPGNHKSSLSNLVGKYHKSGQFVYHQTFDLGPDIEPLLTTQNGELVSFIYNEGNPKVVLLPQILEGQAEFLVEFFNKVAPDLFPELFPDSAKNQWTKESQYWLPYHESLVEEEALIRSEYEPRLIDLRNRKEENNQRFEFLHKILTETDNELKDSLIEYFRYLGFEDVIDFDAEKTKFKRPEEDIQIRLSNGGLIVVECKGIGGTSTDDQCLQITKIKNRRCEERKNSDVYALYVVNHQRHLPPFDRDHPPFQAHQIEDAINAKQGMVSTWDLFQLCFSIEQGVISKEEARDQLLEFGLIQFRPKNLAKIDFIGKVYQNNTICIVKVENFPLTVGDEIFEEKNEQYQKLKIESIRVDDRDVTSANNGELGIRLSGKVSKGSTLWKRQPTPQKD